MSRRWVLGLFVAGAGLAGFLVWPFFHVIEVSDGRTGRTAFCGRVEPGEEFIISFVHSVNRRPVYDTLRAEGDRLVIVKSRFDAFGAGMPDASTDEGTLAVTKDGWLEWTVNRPVPDLTIRVGRVAGHTLHLKEREIRLADLAQPGTPLTVRTGKMRIIDFIKGRCIP